MNSSDYIIKRLSNEGITHAFLVQGSANNTLIFSIADDPGIKYICGQHEAACGHMAEGWSKVSGKTGFVCATSGPGGQNLATAIANCWYDSVPVLFITGQVNSRFMRRSKNMRQLGFQEWNPVAAYSEMTKYAELVTDPLLVPGHLENALHACREGRYGPALLDLPIDVQRADIGAYEDWTRFTPPPPVYNVALEIDLLIEDLKKARRPVLLIGGGVRGSRAVEAFDVLANALRIPVFPTWNALDVVTSDHPWYGGRIGTYGAQGRNFALQNADLLIAVGCRISGRITGGKPDTFARGAKTYVVDVDPGLLDAENQETRVDVSILCDAETFMREFAERWRHAYTSYFDQGGDFERHLENRTLWWNRAVEWRDRYDPVLPEMSKPGPVHFYAFARELSRQAPANAVIAYDCGGNAVVMNHAFRTKRGQTYFSNHGNSPMGFSLCGAVGAWFADPSRPVICVIGDGGMQLNIQELQTIKNYGVNVKVFILDNGIYGITQAFQATHYPGRNPEASGPPHYSTPDFVEVAHGYKIEAFRVTGNEAIEGGIQSALSSPEACVCVVSSPGFHEYWPALKGWAAPIEDMEPLLPRDEFRANMIIDPLPGWETGDYK